LISGEDGSGETEGVEQRQQVLELGLPGEAKEILHRLGPKLLLARL